MSKRIDWRATRQKEAIERQKTYDALSTSKKIALAKSRPGNSKREIDRLSERLKDHDKVE